MTTQHATKGEQSAQTKCSLLYVIFISAVAAIGGFLFGFDSGVINGTVSALGNTFNSSSVATGFNVASVLLGCALGALAAGPLADKFGRRAIMIVTALIFAISAFGSGIADSSAEFIFYRLFGGLGIGAASVLAPAYIAEVAPASLRGRLATLQQLAIVLGLFAAFLSNYLIANAAGGAEGILLLDLAAWRWMFWAELVPAGLFLIGVLFIPESPRYLVAQGKLKHAKTVFNKISNDDADAQINDVKQSLKSDKKPSIRDLFIDGSKKVHPIVWVGVALSVFQQFVGINVVFYYGSELWQAAGFDESQSLFINVLAGTTNILSTFIAIALVDKVGRKPLLLVGSIGMFISLSALTYTFGSAGLDEAGKLALSENMGTFALIMANLFVVFFGLSWGPIVWVLLGEMFNNRIRGAALAVAASAQWIANFAITMTFPIMLGSIGLAGAYGFYTLSAFISVFFVVKYIKETRGMKLESM
ncbi:Sugar transporter family protein [Pseudoalteromonas issachenkonii]|jgi:SP family sugar:H+ symporter-like MFS transporter|uniref:MFS transporter, SP family, sugar:H+ symporter n=1 Tax=Pseudoalteromonas issachenkonii TaxID=152297 RepID=A0ABM6N4A3_9GAMM|nr:MULTISPECIES: sugar porter family MFS transporter [Pseudoalteromonas]ALQ55289.1 Sugar transporter family protein [Pseudoalteromonas issachenkonii]ATC91134.1 MFS transporter, SP family, sugar:H+ symporter [Pseudoalteromonas issachenkonii]MDN3431430.1 sugar porter family MFS transporter [Pseudoalteromonas sp. APC 3907]MDN3463792.1 sugar porter family MFS transporter [Pseudoalteromonas sp. APC 3495]